VMSNAPVLARYYCFDQASYIDPFSGKTWWLRESGGPAAREACLSQRAHSCAWEVPGLVLQVHRRRLGRGLGTWCSFWGKVVSEQRPPSSRRKVGASGSTMQPRRPVLGGAVRRVTSFPALLGLVLGGLRHREGFLITPAGCESIPQTPKLRISRQLSSCKLCS